MSNIFAQLLQEGDKQKEQLEQIPTRLQSPQEVFESHEVSDSTTEAQQTVVTARQPDSTTARQQNNVHDYLRSFLNDKATQKTTLRYPPSLMTEIEDVIYQIKRTYGVTLSKNEIVVLGLAHVLYDFKRNANHSALSSELIHPTEK